MPRGEEQPAEGRQDDQGRQPVQQLGAPEVQAVALGQELADGLGQQRGGCAQPTQLDADQAGAEEGEQRQLQRIFS